MIGGLGAVGNFVRNNTTIKSGLTTVALVAAVGLGLLAVHLTKSNPQSVGGVMAGVAALVSAGVAFGAGLQSAFKERKKEDQEITIEIFSPQDEEIASKPKERSQRKIERDQEAQRRAESFYQQNGATHYNPF